MQPDSVADPGRECISVAAKSVVTKFLDGPTPENNPSYQMNSQTLSEAHC